MLDPQSTEKANLEFVTRNRDPGTGPGWVMIVKLRIWNFEFSVRNRFKIKN